MFLEEENVGITIIVDRTREKFSFISHLFLFRIEIIFFRMNKILKILFQMNFDCFI